MGLLVHGKWVDRWYDTDGHKGHFVRSAAQFRNWVTPDGSPGPSGRGGFMAEPGRYHLYVSLACPWANRTLIFRHLKGLEEMIGLSVVHWYMTNHGWTFQRGDGVIPDPLFNAQYLHQVYTHAASDYSGRVTVPVLWDKQEETVVSNESSEIIRMFNSAFDGIGALPGDYYPADLHNQIDEIIYVGKTLACPAGDRHLPVQAKRLNMSAGNGHIGVEAVHDKAVVRMQRRSPLPVTTVELDNQSAADTRLLQDRRGRLRFRAHAAHRGTCSGKND